MAGQSCAWNGIVPDNEILAYDFIRNEIWRCEDLLHILNTPREAMEWCARRRLLKNFFIYPQCGQHAALHCYAEGINSFRWRCNPCGVTKTVHHLSFLTIVTYH